MNSAPGRRELSFVATRRALQQSMMLGASVRRRDIAAKLQMINEPAIFGDEVRDESYRVALDMELRAHARLDDFPHGVARQLAGPLGQALPRHPLPAPASAQV